MSKLFFPITGLIFLFPFIQKAAETFEAMAKAVG